MCLAYKEPPVLLMIRAGSSRVWKHDFLIYQPARVLDNSVSWFNLIALLYAGEFF
jgi:hypothetical protein